MSTLKVDNLLLQNNTTGTGRILEVVSGVCDGRSITTQWHIFVRKCYGYTTSYNYCVTYYRVFNYIHSS